MLEAAAQMYCMPQVNFTVKEWGIEGKKILEVKIPQDIYKPYKAPDHEGNYKAFVRVHDQNLLAPPVLLEVWKWKKSNRPINLRYNEEIETLFHYLRMNKYITINTFCKVSKINKAKAKSILVKLIVLKQIEINIQENETYYRLGG